MHGIPGEGMLAGKTPPEAPEIPYEGMLAGKTPPEAPEIPDEGSVCRSWVVR